MVRTASARASSSEAAKASRVDHVGADVAARHAGADEPARVEALPGERLVEAGDRLVAQQLPHGEQVERDLELLAIGPAGAGRDRAALVVVDDRGAAGAEVDAVDAAR